MKTLKEFISEKKESDSQHLAGLDIENEQKLYQVAMRAKDAKELEKSMMKLQAQFPDKDKINFKEVNWETVYADLNESDEKTDTQIIIEAILETK